MECCGVDLHAEYSQIYIFDESGEVTETSRVRTSRRALERFFRQDSMLGILVSGDSLPLFESGTRGQFISKPRVSGRQHVGHTQCLPQHKDSDFRSLGMTTSIRTSPPKFT